MLAYFKVEDSIRVTNIPLSINKKDRYKAISSKINTEITM